MCDTLVALGNATADGTTILAKNSDREPNEAQVLCYAPRTRHAPGTQLTCTYISIPQVAETYAVLLSRPFGMWGAEMGVNEYAVAIGNEAVFTREPYGKEPALTGMDLLRLALERADTAQKALEVIVALLETYGQGGDCGFRHPFYYHNSFLIADPHEAWVLETVGRVWAAQRVPAGVRTISNQLTIAHEWDRSSPDLVSYALERRWCRSQKTFHFARCYSDFVYTRFGGAQARRCRSTGLLAEQQGAITVETMITALRDHGPEASADPTWGPDRGWWTDTLCVHAGFGPTRPSQTTSSMVAHLTESGAVVWLTGTSAPCTGLFKPVYIGPEGCSLPDLGPDPTGVYDPHSLWWNHERLHRAVLRDYAHRMAVYRAERDELEQAFQGRATAVRTLAEWVSFTQTCFRRAAKATDCWVEAVQAEPIARRPARLFSIAWRRFNREAEYPFSK